MDQLKEEESNTSVQGHGNPILKNQSRTNHRNELGAGVNTESVPTAGSINRGNPSHQSVSETFEDKNYGSEYGVDAGLRNVSKALEQMN